MTKLILIRHAETDWSKKDARYCGLTDIELNETGLAQAQLLSRYLASEPLKAIYSSSLKRALQTAQIIAEPHQLNIKIVAQLNEINYGYWEGKTPVEIEAEWPDLFRRWRRDPEHIRIPGGETFAELRERAWPAFLEIAKEHPHETIAVSGHKSTNRVLICQLLGLSLSEYRTIGQANGAINIILASNDILQISSINDTCPLSNLQQNELSTRRKP